MSSLTTGEQLRKFFLELLEDKKLEEYHQDRRAYIGGRSIRESDGYLEEEAEGLLMSQDLWSIEDHIMTIEGSKALPLFVVSPPYS
jgi:hypothetical protein